MCLQSLDKHTIHILLQYIYQLFKLTYAQIIYDIIVEKIIARCKSF